MKTTVFVFAMLFSCATFAQDEVYSIVEEMPVYPGGEEALFKFIGDNIRYPEEAKAAKVQGIVYLSFVVNKKGKVRDITVIRGIGSGCDEAAIEMARAMPNWTPGRQRGKNVNVQYNLPVRFSLEKSN
jgi:TonB family protein